MDRTELNKLFSAVNKALSVGAPPEFGRTTPAVCI